MIRILILSLLAPAAFAQDYPALHVVTGVAADDVLNIRAAPDASAEIVGTLAPDASGIEVVETSGNWALVNTGERSGYAALRFLKPEPGAAWNALQTPLTCLGTEPFWALTLDPAARTATMISSDDLNGNATRIGEVWPGTPWAPMAALSIPEGMVVLSPAACNDGMSDRSFGIGIDMFLTSPETLRLSGCCSLGLP